MIMMQVMDRVLTMSYGISSAYPWILVIFFLDDTKTLNILAYLFVHAMILFKQNSFSIIKICLPFCLQKRNEVAYAGIIANGVSCMGMRPV